MDWEQQQNWRRWGFGILDDGDDGDTEKGPRRTARGRTGPRPYPDPWAGLRAATSENPEPTPNGRISEISGIKFALFILYRPNDVCVSEWRVSGDGWASSRRGGLQKPEKLQNQSGTSSKAATANAPRQKTMTAAR
ncbi:hypothetical protein WR25_19092 [Diploscapter pachys]|uniref:Uncharacterized protein n=1 Tax=Diploscapter pachys TaxID=2018661 RepID=A0A2A2L0Q5_9BILA|nr:hypothetical protein WR25_19092 [Diploscapter pachys]